MTPITMSYICHPGYIMHLNSTAGYIYIYMYIMYHIYIYIYNISLYMQHTCIISSYGGYIIYIYINFILAWHRLYAMNAIPLDIHFGPRSKRAPAMTMTNGIHIIVSIIGNSYSAAVHIWQITGGVLYISMTLSLYILYIYICIHDIIYSRYIL